MMKLIIRFLLLTACWPLLAQSDTNVLSFDPPVGWTPTGYRAIFSQTLNGPSFKTLDFTGTSVEFDDTGFASDYYVNVVALDANGTTSGPSNSVHMGLAGPTRVFPSTGWKSVTALTFDKTKVLRVGGFTWPGPVWSVTGGSYPGASVPAPIVDINGIYFCDWPYGLAQCQYKP